MPPGKNRPKPVGEPWKNFRGVVGFRVNPLLPTTPPEKIDKNPLGNLKFFSGGGCIGYTSTVNKMRKPNNCEKYIKKRHKFERFGAVIWVFFLPKFNFHKNLGVFLSFFFTKFPLFLQKTYAPSLHGSYVYKKGQ